MNTEPETQSPGMRQNSSELSLITRSIGILALLTGLVYLRAIGLESAAAWRSGEPVSAVLLFVLLLVAIVGLLLAWWREGLGGFVAASSAVGIGLLAYLTIRENRLFSAFAYSSPFLVAGLLFLCCWWRDRGAMQRKRQT